MSCPVSPTQGSATLCCTSDIMYVQAAQAVRRADYKIYPYHGREMNKQKVYVFIVLFGIGTREERTGLILAKKYPKTVCKNLLEQNIKTTSLVTSISERKGSLIGSVKLPYQLMGCLGSFLSLWAACSATWEILIYRLLAIP